MVNIAGFLAIQKLTTNVTGHFAFFAEEVFKLHFRTAMVYSFYILSFFLGSFVSGLLIEITVRKGERFIYIFPVIIEAIILTTVGSLFFSFVVRHPDFVAFSLLFAMGLQNALVTSISKATVRTTHLTGLFTDLGIELSQLFFYVRSHQKEKLLSSIRLRFTIIIFFLLGGIAAGILYQQWRLHTLVVAGLLLIAGLLYDSTKLSLLLARRRLRIHSKKTNEL